MKCPNCRQENDERARYCDRCGAEIPLSIRMCNTCSETIPHDAEKCPYCGATNVVQTQGRELSWTKEYSFMGFTWNVNHGSKEKYAQFSNRYPGYKSALVMKKSTVIFQTALLGVIGIILPCIFFAWSTLINSGYLLGIAIGFLVLCGPQFIWAWIFYFMPPKAEKRLSSVYEGRYNPDEPKSV